MAADHIQAVDRDLLPSLRVSAVTPTGPSVPPASHGQSSAYCAVTNSLWVTILRCLAKRGVGGRGCIEMCAGAIGETGLFYKRAGGAGSSLMGAALWEQRRGVV